MLRRRLVTIALAVCAMLHPAAGFGMGRAEMDLLLRLARTSPDSPEFRAALMKAFPDADVKAGTAFNSNGPDFIWAVESAKPPAIIIDDKPAGPIRQIAGTTLWFYVAQLKVGTAHRFHY